MTEAEQIRQLEREIARLREERAVLRKEAKYFPARVELVIRLKVR